LLRRTKNLRLVQETVAPRGRANHHRLHEDGAVDVLKRFSAPAGVLGEQWLTEQERLVEGRDSTSV